MAKKFFESKISTQNNTVVTHYGIFRNEIQKNQEGIKTYGIFVEQDFLLDASNSLCDWLMRAKGASQSQN